MRRSMRRPISFGIAAMMLVLLVVVVYQWYEGIESILYNNASQQLETPSTPDPSLPPDKRRKPKLIIHVGPPKTGTTSLQTDLTSMETVLAKDNYVYAGRYYRPVFHERRQKLALHKSYSKILEAARNIPARPCEPDSHNNKDCGLDFKRRLDEYKVRNINVIVSDESLLHFWSSVEYIHSLYSILNDEWDVMVVIGYRRFYAWFPSQVFQLNRLDHPDNPYLNNWPGDHHAREIEPIIPDFLKRWRQFVYTDQAIRFVRPYFDHQILSLHDPSPLSTRSQFLCNILTDARHSCSESLSRDQEHDDTTMNQRLGYDTMWYDSMATFLARHNKIQTTKASRRQVAASIATYNEQTLNQTGQDLPMSCPTMDELQDFLQLSLRLEQSIQPLTYKETVSEHTTDFWKKAMTDPYCWVDPDAVFALPQWKAFLKQQSWSKI